MILYHGTSVINALSIMNNGFNLDKCGSNWGNTYGKGIYFTPNYETARFYAGNEGIVIKVNIKINGQQLKKYYSPNSKNKPKIEHGKNALISVDNDEYLVVNFID